MLADILFSGSHCDIHYRQHEQEACMGAILRLFSLLFDAANDRGGFAYFDFYRYTGIIYPLNS